jgi:hypothetical protein
MRPVTWTGQPSSRIDVRTTAINEAGGPNAIERVREFAALVGPEAEALLKVAILPDCEPQYVSTAGVQSRSAILLIVGYHSATDHLAACIGPRGKAQQKE